MRRSLVLLLLFVGCTFGVNAVKAQAQTTPAPVTARNANDLDQAQVLRILLEEVRLLRLTLERSQRNGVLLQATVERLRLQQESVNLLSQKLEDCRSELIVLQASLPRLPEQIKEMERRVQSSEDQAARTVFEGEIKAAQLAYEEQRERAERQRLRADQLAAQLQEEQRKLDDLFDRFAQIEQQLSDTGKAPARR